MAITLSTDNKLEYRFYPVNGRQIQFRIKAPNDAHIALTTGPNESDPMWEVFIGGWNNSKSVVRKNRTKPDVIEVNTPNILSADELRGFWIRWNDGEITVGMEGEQSSFLSYTDPEPFEITHFGVCTGWGASGEWLIEDATVAAPTPSAPDDQLSSIIWSDVKGGVLPPGAVVGGEDDEPLYIGRANHEGALLPGKVKFSHGVCYVAWGGLEHTKTEYQVLCNCSPMWMPVSGNNIPPNALPAGQTEDGEPLFVGRINHQNTLTLGKVHPSHGCLYIPFGGEEIPFNDYEILIN
ncbi:PREDICTED: C3 and PZP-like alpha-2-macroglobulin domain-containing protein 8 isoform X2 [Ceratosolen solmsi marchali]|uniref:C3 and PZP-like alpha-2-macroglobulin domain-containing protein 8 isoform X2 n=1 Tax=Ceratosolen solmsi marchali TaxID=326594 RepID=A0AAJ6YTH9_9HYME|nr:PREDICTED: C3 and PZP-like alpha-2-macroglobulin domain-containing protein 8 isoform X2 [Ceratosolen solmsi marchali]